jgi:integral membrane sensor domain MASE1
MSKTTKHIVIILLLAAGYAFLSLVCLRISWSGSQASPVWFPAGLGMWAFAKYRCPALVGVYIGAVIANALTLPNGAEHLSLFTALGNTAEAAICGHFCRRKEISTLLIIFIGCAVSAAWGPSILVYYEASSMNDYGQLVMQWWTGDVLGCITAQALVFYGNK